MRSWRHTMSMKSFVEILTSFFKVHHEHEILQNLLRRTINLAYEAEIAIDSILAQYNSLWHLFCSLPTIIEEIKHISVEVAEMLTENLSLKLGSVVKPSEHLSTQHSNQPVNDDEMIVSHFDIRAWCCISQTYSWGELLQEILDKVSRFKNKIDNDGDLADMLKKVLMCKRYLIVLDDMWDVMAWDDLRLSFPDVENGSRIIVTTRLGEVGKQIKHYTDLYSLPFLTPEESQELLHKKVFQNEGYLPELHDASLAVAKRCKELPLVIVLAAVILKQNKMEESWWHEVQKSLLSYLAECEEYSFSTMQLSYDNLADHLRPYFLYMGMFPEDRRIPASQLICLWIAESFVQNIESGRLEDAGEGCLNDLVSSNLVMVSKRRMYDGKVKYCQVHDVVLHFCLERSREEKFMSAVKG